MMACKFYFGANKIFGYVPLRRLVGVSKPSGMEGGTAKEKYLHDFTYAGREISVDEARDVISKYSDDRGSVDLDVIVDGIAKVRLNNPATRNAINAKMMFDMEKIVNTLDRSIDECKGVILYGADGNFCSGGDLNMVKEISKPELGYAMATYMNHILEKFRHLPMITVAYIEGSGALGGGAELTTACDYRLMCDKVDTTGIGFVHGKMGIVPAWGSTGRLVSIAGRQKALDLLLDSRPLGAAEATAVGLVDGTAATLADATEWLSRKTRHHVNVIRAIKRTLLCHGGGDDRQRAAAALAERRIFAPLWGGPANQEALEKHFKRKK